MIKTNMNDTAALEFMSSLVYELLDAHQDTANLAADMETDPDWAAHLDYLRDLQRVAREGLARIPVPSGCPTAP